MNGLNTMSTSDAEFVRLPGLYRRWELEQVIETGVDIHVEEAGAAEDGTLLLAVYRREGNPVEARSQYEAARRSTRELPTAAAATPVRGRRVHRP